MQNTVLIMPFSISVEIVLRNAFKRVPNLLLLPFGSFPRTEAGCAFKFYNILEQICILSTSFA
jgi:hypothetical protein